MNEPRLVTTKALSAYLKSCHTSLSAAIAMIGLDQETLNGEFISADILGRIARLRGTTSEHLTQLTSAYESDVAPAVTEDDDNDESPRA